MTIIGYATLQLIPSLRGVSEAIRRASRDLKIHADVEVDGAQEAGRRAGRGIRQGIDSARIGQGARQQFEQELSAANGSSIGRRFGASIKSAVTSAIGGIKGISLDGAVSGGESAGAAVGRIALGARIASVAARGLSRSLTGVSLAVAAIGGGGLGRLAVGLRLVSTAAAGAARDIGRITSSLIVLMAVGRGISMLNRLGKIAAVGTIGFSALLGVLTGVATMIGGPLLAALAAATAAMGAAAGAAAGILGPAVAALKIGFAGLGDGAKAYAASQKGGASQAKASAAAAKQVEQAEKAVERAKRDSRDAERDLTRARKDAQEQLEDMALALRGSALSEKDAQLSLMEAHRDLQNLGKDGQPVDMIDRERAVLRVQEAEQRLAETQESNGDLAEKAAEADRLGVEGSDQVVAAKQRLVDANEAVAEAEQQVADARQAAADAQSGGDSGVDPFDAMIGQRMAPVLDAFKNLKHSVTDSLSSAMIPGFQVAGRLLDGFAPKLSGLSGLFGTIGTEVATTLSGPTATKGFDAMFAASDKFFSAFKGERGIGGLATGLVAFAGNAGTAFAGLGSGINSTLAGWGDKLAKITPELITAGFQQLRQVITNIGNVIGPIFSGLRQLGAITAPALAPGFKSIGEAIGKATPGVMQMARVLMPALSQSMTNLAPLLPSLVDTFTPWASVVAVLAPHIATLASHLGPLAPVILGVALAAKVVSGAVVLCNAAFAAGSIAQGVYAAATGASSASLGTNTIALGAQRVALVAGAVAQKAVAAAVGLWTGAQWLLNAALDANPIGLVVLAIAALVGGIIYAYNHSETFRKIVDAAWKGIKVAAEAVVNWFVDTAWPFLKKVWEGIGDGWDWLVTKAGEVWNGVKEKFTSIVTFVTSLPQKITDGAKGMWEGLKSGLREVLQWIADKWNSLADSLSFTLPDALGGAKIQPLPRMVVGSFDEGGYTGNLPTKQIAGVVHGDEQVIRAASRRMLEAAHPGLLDYMNQTGKLPGYEGGGRVAYGLPKGTNTGGYGSSGNVFPDWVHAIEKRFGVKASTYAGHQEKDGLNKGIDWVGSVESMQAFAEYLKSIRGELEQVIWMNPKTGEKIGVAGGQLVGPGTSQPQYYAADWGGHQNHVHTRQSYSFGGAGATAGLGSAVAAAGASPVADALAGKGLQGITDSGALMAEAGTGSGSGSAGSVPTSLSGLASFGLDGLGVDTPTPTGTRRFEFGKAASAAVSGQVGSLLGVFGIPDSPSWLGGLSNFAGQIKIGGPVSPTASAMGGALGSASAMHAGTGAGPGPIDDKNPLLYDNGGWLPEGMSLTNNETGGPEAILTQGMWDVAQKGVGIAMSMAKGFVGGGGQQQQQPTAPQVNYTINARDTEDAFIRARRQEAERAAAKLSRY